MSNIWIISDLHFGHRNITKYRTEFSSEEEHRMTIKENILSAVKKRDLLWVLGDSVIGEEGLQDFADIPCPVNLVVGNHCAENFDQKLLYQHCNKVYGLTKRYGCWLTHCPIHTDELRGSFCVHGHTHNHIIQRYRYSGVGERHLDDDPRYINMCVEHHNYKPRDLNWLRGELENRRLLK